jgi:hypothetical protein
MRKNKKYFIVLFIDQKENRTIHSSLKKDKIIELWRNIKKEKKPPFIKHTLSHRSLEMKFELLLIFRKDNNKKQKNNDLIKDHIIVKDNIGRNKVLTLDKDNFIVKEIIPYWVEETIWDFNNKKKIKYNQLISIIKPINELTQIYTLNNKIIIHNDNMVKLFGLRNIPDTIRLFNLIKNDLVKIGKGNFFFIRDVNTTQRVKLYEILENLGYNRNRLIRHYAR